MMKYDHKDFVWSEEQTIETCITKDPTFPKLIQITSGFNDDSFERTFDNHEIIFIVDSVVQSRIEGYDAKKLEFSLPKTTMLKFKETPNSHKEPEFLITLLGKKKLPIKVFLSEDCSHNFPVSDLGLVQERLSDIQLTRETNAHFFIGIPLEDSILDASNAITLPSYLLLTFRVAKCFEDKKKNFKVFFNQLHQKVNDWITPNPIILQDIVFQEHLGRSISPIIVSLEKVNEVKKSKPRERPLPAIPMQETKVIDSSYYSVIQDDVDKSERSPSSYGLYSEFPYQNTLIESRLTKEGRNKMVQPIRCPYKIISKERGVTKKVEMSSPRELTPKLNDYSQLPKIQPRLSLLIPRSEQNPSINMSDRESLVTEVETSSSMALSSRLRNKPIPPPRTLFKSKTGGLYRN